MGHRIVLALSAVFVLLVICQGTAMASWPTAQLTFDAGNQGRPDVSGNVVVWKDNRSGNFDIYMDNLLTGVESPIVIDPAYQNLPQTNGLIVVWQDNRSGDNDIYMKNLLTGIVEPLVDGPGNQMMPAISGNMVVYVDNQVASSPTDTDPNNNIYEIDLSTRTITPVCTAAGSQWEPHISGNRIVWQDYRNGKWDVYVNDNGIEQPVCIDPGSHAQADIDGNRIIWQDYRDNAYAIWMKDLSTGISQSLTANTAYKTSPAISGDLVVWQDYRNDANPSDSLYDYDIYMKDLTSGVETGLATGTAVQAYPSVDKETVVWEQTGSQGYDIWMAKVPDVTPPVITPQSPASGSVNQCNLPEIEASLADNRTGVDPDSIQMQLDGQDVSDAISKSDSNVNYEPPPLTAGQHTVTVTAADMAGNTASRSWQFTVEAPRLNLPYVRDYWASYTDYQNYQLTVVYTIGNISTQTTATATRVVTSLASSGVGQLTQTPEPLGDIVPGATADAALVYQLPAGVSSFKTNVFIECTDVCGNAYNFPGPPPQT